MWLLHVSNKHSKLSVIWSIHMVGKSGKNILEIFAENIVT